MNWYVCTLSDIDFVLPVDSWTLGRASRECTVSLHTSYWLIEADLAGSLASAKGPDGFRNL